MARFVKGDVVVVLFPFSDLSDVSNFSFFRSFLTRSVMQSMD
ncbi:hypothetical protein HMPREF1705_04751 [Acetomicrobium hydrogeniformans ATCC BAA-1850]|uniref:Uncharacterized protein n=1 Tax=Acetomicrobium hydrogeniformans ATCC BAA-1850 TaxID=592015 RepID=A0A0T5X7U6_9BACT|nr:hypothetical protein HMPREF1705_04751 [Acetomicrobium hydrogeniformans ATCC BAA-1850]